MVINTTDRYAIITEKKEISVTPENEIILNRRKVINFERLITVQTQQAIADVGVILQNDPRGISW